MDMGSPAIIVAFLQRLSRSIGKAEPAIASVIMFWYPAETEEKTCANKSVSPTAFISPGTFPFGLRLAAITAIRFMYIIAFVL